MKNWYLILMLFSFICAFYSCDNEIELAEKLVTIEKTYPFYLETRNLDNMDRDSIELFNQKIVTVNSIEQLENYRLLNFYPETTRESLISCDFEKYTLILTSSLYINEITDLEYKLVIETSSSKYIYYQTLHCQYEEEPYENIYLIVNAFLIKKISENTSFDFAQSVILYGYDW